MASFTEATLPHIGPCIKIYDVHMHAQIKGDCQTPRLQPTAEQKAPAPKQEAHPSGNFATCRMLNEAHMATSPHILWVRYLPGQLSARPEPWTKEYTRGDADLRAAVAAGTAVCCHQAHSAAHAYV